MITIRGLFARLFLRLFSLFPLQDKIVFCSFRGKNYGDNPGCIFREMQPRFPNINYIWLMEKKVNIPNAKCIRFSSIMALYHLATAKVWIDNSRKQLWMIKRKSQYYVQTWHGDVCIKTIEKDAESFLPKDYVAEAKHDSKLIDLLISGSDFRTTNFKSAFWYDGEIIEEGTPKSVVYYLDPKPIRDKVFSYFGIKDNQSFVLYCPTFRSDSSLDKYDLDCEEVLKALTQKDGKQWVILYRLHPKVSSQQNNIIYSDTVLNASGYLSTDELIIASDMIITDYSGCMFNGIEANKPVLLYANDIDEYLNKDRGMYFDIRDLPFPLAEDNQQLIKNIERFNEDDYLDNIKLLKKQIGFKTNVESTSRIVDYIVNAVWGEME